MKAFDTGLYSPLIGVYRSYSPLQVLEDWISAALVSASFQCGPSKEGPVDQSLGIRTIGLCSSIVVFDQY